MSQYIEAALSADDPRHGTRNGYNNYGCRCKACRAARLAYDRAYRNRRPRPVAVDWLRGWRLDETDS